MTRNFSSLDELSNFINSPILINLAQLIIEFLSKFLDTEKLIEFLFL